MLIDTHTHLYSSKFAPDRAAMMARIPAAGVALSIMPAIDSTSHRAMLDLEADYPESTLSMMGLHPVSVKDNYEEELAIVRGYLDSGRTWVAIGEIGMDLYWDKTYQKQQEAAFLTQCAWAIEFDLPICIHARDSIDELLVLIERVGDEKLRGVFHCWTGSTEQANRAVSLGFYLGIGGVATFKNGGIGPSIEQVAHDRLLLETDAPYLAPTPYRGKRNETAYLPKVADKVAELWKTSVAEVARQTTTNAWQLFDLDRFAHPDLPWVK
ncbi:TatD family hydrolase [Neolewinella antarctica]|uniref:TatD DNase family protein n=1 Tax=Neolewinella antarctica TaxID=442734 RepID=A0ABX0X932_9BACT|nr:TatD family hydrolase [Neolewinella antarctica]NJC25765.1 TatD DNase family protein [Neolewinella antarctica]